MRPHRLLLACAAAVSFSIAAQAADPQAPAEPARPAPATVSPFLEFRAVGAGSQASIKSASSVSRKPPFQMTITTPTTNFAHMRRGASNATLECIIPGDLRRD